MEKEWHCTGGARGLCDCKVVLSGRRGGKDKGTNHVEEDQEKKGGKWRSVGKKAGAVSTRLRGACFWWKVSGREIQGERLSKREQTFAGPSENLGMTLPMG